MPLSRGPCERETPVRSLIPKEAKEGAFREGSRTLFPLLGQECRGHTLSEVQVARQVAARRPPDTHTTSAALIFLRKGGREYRHEYRVCSTPVGTGSLGGFQPGLGTPGVAETVRPRLGEGRWGRSLGGGGDLCLERPPSGPERGLLGSEAH